MSEQVSAMPVERIEEVSPAWMRQALGPDIEFSDLSSKPIGTGQMADSFRVELLGLQKGPSPELASVVVKMQAADQLARLAGAGGSYRSEVGFYTDLAATVSIRTPECFYATGPDDDGRFALVLQDMAPAQQGDQLLGCSPEQARAAVVNLAGLHGSRWCDPSLKDLSWLRYVTQVEADYFQETLAESTKGFIQYYADRLTEPDVEILQAFAPKCGSWLLDRRKQFTLVHGDYRLDNLLFGSRNGDVSVSAVDWQTLEVGNPGRDLAYFLGNSLLPAQRRAHEQALVRAYHEALLSYDVEDYSFEACMDDYRFGQFQGPLITVLAAHGLAHTARGDDMFIAMCTRACEAIRDLGSLEML
ncbi:MAG: hypothetical protein ACI9UU_000149 [Candidatus Azotimanducaceae bacterium]